MPQAPVIVVGLDAVGLAIVHRLHARRVPVRALATARELASWGGELGQLGVEVETVGEAWDTALRRVDLSGCSTVVLAADDDSANVDACLLIRRFHADLPVVARVSDGTLVRFLQMTVPHVEVYSMGSTTAPVAAEIAVQLLSQVRPSRALPYAAHHDDGAPRPGFVLDDPAYKGAEVLIAGDNFGCGSSREHAPWALQQYGFRALIAPSFADIFFNNTFKNGVLPIVLPERQVARLFDEVFAFPGYQLTVDLERQVVVKPDGEELPFDVQPFRKYCLLNGFDDIGLTLRHADKIKAYEAERIATKPWLNHRITR